ncbi:MAG: type II toxin-antitoxin system RelE/ParE family toxin [Patescibacteria group bacterium]|nr:type II toxin-antitoxin system RelE/ParE family toxin [Patescibacteria group bacterium]
MNRYKIRLSKRSVRDMEFLSLNLKNRIIEKLYFYVEQENPLFFAKKLTGYGKKTYRFRIGDYRAVFRVDEQGKVIVLLVVRVLHRKEIYRRV